MRCLRVRSYHRGRTDSVQPTSRIPRPVTADRGGADLEGPCGWRSVDNWLAWEPVDHPQRAEALASGDHDAATLGWRVPRRGKGIDNGRSRSLVGSGTVEQLRGGRAGCSRTCPGPWHASHEGTDGQRGMRKGRYVRRRAEDWCNTTPPERYTRLLRSASFLGAFQGFRRSGLGNTFTPHPPVRSKLRFVWLWSLCCRRGCMPQVVWCSSRALYRCWRWFRRRRGSVTAAGSAAKVPPRVRAGDSGRGGFRRRFAGLAAGQSVVGRAATPTRMRMGPT